MQESEYRLLIARAERKHKSFFDMASWSDNDVYLPIDYVDKLIAINTIKGSQGQEDALKITDLRNNKFVVLPMTVINELRNREKEILEYMRQGASVLITEGANFSVKTGKFSAEIYDEKEHCYRTKYVHIIAFMQDGVTIKIVDVTLCKFLQVPAMQARRNSTKMCYVVLNNIKHLEIYEDVFRLIDTRNDTFVEMPIRVLHELNKKKAEIVRLLENDECSTIFEDSPYLVKTGFYINEHACPDGVSVIRFKVNSNYISIRSNTFCKIFQYFDV